MHMTIDKARHDGFACNVILNGTIRLYSLSGYGRYLAVSDTHIDRADCLGPRSVYQQAVAKYDGLMRVIQSGRSPEAVDRDIGKFYRVYSELILTQQFSYCPPKVLNRLPAGKKKPALLRGPAFASSKVDASYI